MVFAMGVMKGLLPPCTMCMAQQGEPGVSYLRVKFLPPYRRWYDNEIETIARNESRSKEHNRALSASLKPPSFTFKKH